MKAVRKFFCSRGPRHWAGLASVVLLLSPGTPFASAERADGFEAIVEDLTEIFVSAMRRSQLADQELLNRPVFAKSHGCLQGRFVASRSLPRELQVGVFAQAEGSGLPAWVRFANDGPIRPDSEPSARGLAIKLIGVSGPRSMTSPSAEDATQDFILQNHPVFFATDARDFRDFLTASISGQPVRPEARAVLNDIDRKLLSNPLDGQYWSPTPFRLGSRAVKYMARPCAGEVPARPEDMQGEDYLRRNLKARIQEADACLRFFVQLQTDPESMPIDDAMAPWRESQSPFIHAADLHFEKGQGIDSPERRYACEALSFNPGRGLQAHESLGSLNLARAEVYRRIAERRRLDNRMEQAEPTRLEPL